MIQLALFLISSAREKAVPCSISFPGISLHEPAGTSPFLQYWGRKREFSAKIPTILLANFFFFKFCLCQTCHELLWQRRKCCYCFSCIKELKHCPTKATKILHQGFPENWNELKGKESRTHKATIRIFFLLRSVGGTQESAEQQLWLFSWMKW